MVKDGAKDNMNPGKETYDRQSQSRHETSLLSKPDWLNRRYLIALTLVMLEQRWQAASDLGWYWLTPAHRHGTRARMTEMRRVLYLKELVLRKTLKESLLRTRTT